VIVREARKSDLESIREIYNQGIEDRVATLDEDPKTPGDIARWWESHEGGRYAILVCVDADAMVGWASLNRFSPRRAYDEVADLSIYVRRGEHGKGIGSVLLDGVERAAATRGFHKIVLFALAENAAGRRLYDRKGFREVGVFGQQGRLDGRYVDVLAMEKIVVKPSRASAHDDAE